MEELITSKEAEKELGISRRTIQRWEEYGWFHKGLVKNPDGTRLYRRSHLQWAGRTAPKWEKLRKTDQEHLRKLAPIQKEIERFIRTQPLERTRDPEPLDLRGFQAVMKKMDLWQAEHREMQKRYAEFFKEIEKDLRVRG